VTQDQLLTLLFKVTLIADIVSIVTFIVIYSLLADWWSSAIGKTIVIMDILIALALLPTILSLFFKFGRLTSHIAAWADVGMFGLLAPVMIWQIGVWLSIHRSRGFSVEVRSAHKAGKRKAENEQLQRDSR
jgi:hypothetical protein